jgi:hypothetical protein
MMYLLLIAGASLILGPIFWMRPTATERRQSRMRLKARSLHLHVEAVSLTHDPVYSALALRNPHWPTTGWMRYRLFAADKEKGPSHQAAWRQRRDKSGQLIWDEDPVAVQASPASQGLLDQWSATQDSRYMALEVGGRSVAIIWNENGDEPEVEQIARWLQAVLIDEAAMPV